jgi:mono/diheme cytochrome c family protein
MKNKFIVYGFIVLFAACASKPLVAAKLKTESKQTAPVVNANDRLSEIINPVNTTDVVSGIAEDDSKENNIISGKKLYDNSCGKCHKLFGPKEFSKQNGCQY